MITKTLFFVTLILSISAKGQNVTNTPNLDKLILWCSSKYKDFDLSVRGLRFQFASKTEKKDRTLYEYKRNATVNGVNYQEKVVYKILKSDKSLVIEYLSNSSDLVSFYSNLNSQYNFTNVTCSNKITKTQTQFCYENSRYYYRILDEPVNGGIGRGYHMIFYKK